MRRIDDWTGRVPQAWRNCACLVLLCVVGCSARPTNDYTAGADDELVAERFEEFINPPPPPSSDAAAMQACKTTPPEDCSGGPQVDPCSSAPTEGAGSIRGTVKASSTAMLLGGHDFMGTLIVSALEGFDASGCPGDPGPPAVGITIVHCVDLTGGRSHDFEIHGVATSRSPWTVLPFLDVNPDGRSVEPQDLLADTCDVGSFPALAMVSEPVAVTLANPFTLGITLGGLEESCGLPACD